MLEQAILYNKHKALASIVMEDGTVKEIAQCLDEELLPIILQGNLTEDTLNEWLMKRRIPEAREGYGAVKREFPNIGRSRNEFSLSDQYWIFYKGGETWDSLNFFTNPYSEDFGRAFFVPWEYKIRHKFPQSPDMTTNGALRKRWTRGPDGTSYLLKAGSKTHHQEPITEVLASIMLKKLDIIPYVEYELVIDGMKLCSRCRNFVDKNSEFVPASHIYFKERRPKARSVYEHLLLMCEKYGISDARDYVDAMIFADHVLGNDDRHLGNFGFLRDVRTGVIKGFAPLFDSGSSYGIINGKQNSSKFFHDREKEVIRKYAGTFDPRKIMDHNEAYSLIDTYPEITKRQRDALKEFLLDMEQVLINGQNEAKIGRIGSRTVDGPSF